MLLFQSFDWKLFLRRLSILAAVGLLALSYMGFISGLNFKGPVLVASCIWASFTVIQFIGNYSEHWDADWLFFATWVFTYMVGIAAGTWAAYNWIGIENEWIRWSCAIGLGGAAELIPERLLAMFVKSLQAKISNKPMWSTNTQNQKSQNKPWEQSKNKQGNYEPKHRPEGGWKKPQESYRPDPFIPLTGAKKLNSILDDREEWSN